MERIKNYLLGLLLVVGFIALVGMGLLVFIFLSVDSYCIGYRQDGFPCTIGWLK
jgi:hypothetical protein